MLIGLTGGIASGKSTVSHLLQQKGLPVIDADMVAREVVTSDDGALREIVACFGANILLPDGTLDRKKLRQEIFSQPEQKKRLDDILLPRIIERRNHYITQLQVKYPHVVYDAALLIESGSYMQMDFVVVVYCETPVQVERLMQRDGVTAQAALEAIHSQMPLHDRVRYADYMIDNSQDRKVLEGKVGEFYQHLVSGKLRPRERSVPYSS